MSEDFFPERLAQLRMKKGVSARDMSLSLGQSENYINMIENKKSFPSMTVFFYICQYLSISPKEFFDDGYRNPERLNAIIEGLKKLDDQSLIHIEGLVKELGNRK